jgi:hypothetical protein
MTVSPSGVGGSQATLPASTGYRMIEATLEQQMAAFKNNAAVKHGIEYFRAAITKVDDADDLVKDYRLFRFVLSAYGLDSQINAQALMKKVLSEDWSDAKSIVNKLVDPHYREIAKALDFYSRGNAKLKSADFLDDVVDRYVTAEFEKSTENTNPGVRLALYFKRMAPDLKNWYQVLGDKALYEVVRTALQIPVFGSQTSVESQAALLEKRIGLDSLKDPKSLERFIGRFLANYDRSNAPATLSVASLIQPLAPSAGGVSLSASTILGLASQKR